MTPDSGDEMVKATEHLEEGITVSVTGRDPDLQAVTRAARLFAKQTLVQRKARWRARGIYSCPTTFTAQSTLAAAQ